MSLLDEIAQIPGAFPVKAKKAPAEILDKIAGIEEIIIPAHSKLAKERRKISNITAKHAFCIEHDGDFGQGPEYVYEVSGSKWGIDSDLLVMAGAADIYLKPRVFRIENIKTAGKIYRRMFIYEGVRLPAKDEKRIVDELGITEMYEMLSILKGNRVWVEPY